MADSTIESEAIMLLDTWPGVANPATVVPTDGFLGTSHHNVATAKYPVGTKIDVYCPGVTVIGTVASDDPGWATFIYLKLEMQDATNVLGARHIVALHSDAVPYDVTNDTTTLLTTQRSPMAVGLSAMTVDRYGWFWCGGICPVDYVDGLNGKYKTTGSVAIGPMTWANAGTPGTTYGELAFSLPNHDADPIVGFAFTKEVD